MRGADKVICQAAAVFLLFAMTSAPAKAQFGGMMGGGGGGEDMMTQMAPMLEMMKARMGKRRFAMMMQTMGPMMDGSGGGGGLGGMMGGMGGMGGMIPRRHGRRRHDGHARRHGRWRRRHHGHDRPDDAHGEFRRRFWRRPSAPSAALIFCNLFRRRRPYSMRIQGFEGGCDARFGVG